MRKLSMKLLLAIGLMIPVFYACDNDDDGPDIAFPTIEATTGDPASVTVGQTVDITYTVTTPGGYASATASTNDTDIATASVSTPGTAGAQTSTVVVTVTGVAAGSTNVTLEVEDEQGQEASDDVAVSVSEATTEPPTETLATIGAALDTAADESLTTLKTALDAAGLTETLNGEEGPYTLFAPNNDAFAGLLEALELENLDAVIAELSQEGVTELLSSHVVADSLSSVEVRARAGGDSLETLGGTMLGISMEGESLLVNGAQIVQADIFAGNGVIHVIDSVVNLPEDVAPPAGEAATVADSIASREDLNSLEAALTVAGLVEPLQEDGPFTVFAPNNDAFAALLAAEEVETLDALVDKIGGAEELAAILQAHVVADSLPADLLAAQDYQTLNENETLTITTEGAAVFVNGAQVLTANILASNGVVHIIDSVVNLPMAPPAGNAATVVDTIAAREDLSSLEAALTTAGLVEPLQAEGPFTVFAPNNDAFAALLAAQEVTTLDELVAKLGIEAVTDILQAHVVAESLTSDAIFDKNVFTTLNGATLTITAEGGNLLVNGATIVEPDLVTGNGVVHIIDQVINVSAANTGANGFTVTITNVSTDQRFFQQGTFGVAEDGSTAPAESYTFSFNAGPIITAGQPTRISFAAMLTGTFDQFLATDQNGITLYNEAGQPITGDITGQVNVYDAGTKDDAGADVATPGPVQLVGNAGAGTPEQPGLNVATVTISNEGTLFTVTVTDAQTEGGISPGVYGVHTIDGPLFRTTQGVGVDGLEALAEGGDPTALSATMARNEGFIVPLSPGVFAIHGSDVSPILVPDEVDRGEGLEALAEDGIAANLGEALAANAAVDSSGVFSIPVGSAEPRAIMPGESYSFTINSAEPGDVLSLATMMVQSNDIIYATSQVGIPLFNGDQPFSGNATPQLYAYDVGTEANEYPGAGLNQPIRQAAPNTGEADPDNRVRRVTTNDVDPAADGFIYRPVRERISVTITPNP